MYRRTPASPDYRAPKRNPALVLIDLQDSRRHEFSYEHGTVEEGLRRTVAVIAEARALCVPVFLVTNEREPEIIAEIIEAAGGARIFTKKTASAFGAPGFETILEATRVDSLIVGGWARHICVRETVLDALGDGYNVVTSGQIVFGKSPSTEPFLREAEIRGFRDQLRIYPTSENLIQAMRREIATFPAGKI